MATPPVSFYADPRALASLKTEARTQSPEAIKEAARQFESLFTQMLLKSMREANKSFGGDSLFGSDQADFYQGMFDDQMALQLSKGEGLGLAEVLIRQLTHEGSGLAARGAGQNAGTDGLLPKPQAPGPAPSHEPIASSKADFVRQLWPHAEQAARQVGVDPHALLAQAALETGWGKAVPCTAAGDCSFNLFGIKAGSQWSGATVNVPTLEFEDGLPVRKVERFRSYESPGDSFLDYARLIRSNPRYENAVGAGGDVGAFASALQDGGYATDPNYARKIVAVADELRALTGRASFDVTGAG